MPVCDPNKSSFEPGDVLLRRDDEGRIQGVVPVRRLLLAPLDKRVAEIMVREVITLPKTATVLDACDFFILHRLLAFPVVDRDRRILGIVDVELYTDELIDLDRSERHNDLFQLIGVHLAEAQQSSAVLAFRRRFPWLWRMLPAESWRRSCRASSRRN